MIHVQLTIFPRNPGSNGDGPSASRKRRRLVQGGVAA